VAPDAGLGRIDSTGPRHVQYVNQGRNFESFRVEVAAAGRNSLPGEPSVSRDTHHFDETQLVQFVRKGSR
jgi:hypothetical protein